MTTGAQPGIVAGGGLARGWLSTARACLLKHEWLRGYTLLSPTLIVMICALALPIFTLVIYSFFVGITGVYWTDALQGTLLFVIIWWVAIAIISKAGVEPLFQEIRKLATTVCGKLIRSAICLDPYARKSSCTARSMTLIWLGLFR